MIDEVFVACSSGPERDGENLYWNYRTCSKRNLFTDIDIPLHHRHDDTLTTQPSQPQPQSPRYALGNTDRERGKEEGNGKDERRKETDKREKKDRNQQDAAHLAVHSAGQITPAASTQNKLLSYPKNTSVGNLQQERTQR